MVSVIVLKTGVSPVNNSSRKILLLFLYILLFYVRMDSLASNNWPSQSISYGIIFTKQL